MMKSKWLVLVAALCLVFALAISASAKTKLRVVWMDYDARFNTVYQTMEQDFEKENPDIDVETIILPWNEGHDRLVTWIAGRQAPDIANTGTRWVLEFNDMGVLEPLDKWLSPEFIKGFYPGALEARIKGKLYGLPVAMSARTLFYRSDLISKPPTTWSELVKVAQEVTSKHKIYGIGVSGKKFVELTEFVYYLYGNGGSFFEIEPDGSYGKAKFNDKAGVEALQFMVDLVHKYKVTEPNVTENDRGSLQDLFIAGKLAMVETGPWFAAMLQERAPNLKWGVAPMPHNDGKPQSTLMVTDSIVMFKSSKNKEAAVKYLNFIYQDKYRLEFNKAFGMLPVRASVGAMSYFQTPYYKVYIDQLPRAQGWPLMSEWAKAEDVLWDAVGAALLKIKPPKQALDEAAKEIDAYRRK
ncbi:MAG: sugar ABC transporter substrate-binding protein [Firmicutes bacterium]|nr:sugar ABC transporter substrate-binding protein [Bacillota bacterium]